MSKQVKAEELAKVVSTLLNAPETLGALESTDAFSAFMTDIAKVVCNHCGGEIVNSASEFDGEWMIGVHGDEAMPDAHGGVWRGIDPDGELWEEGSARWFEQNYEHEHPTLTRYDWQDAVANHETRLGYWEWVSDRAGQPKDDLSTCTECGAEVESITGCPDGAELCDSCFAHANH